MQNGQKSVWMPKNGWNRTMDLVTSLKELRKSHELPALGMVAVVKGKPEPVIVTGTRRLEGTEPARTTDAFHLGSDTKAMTAALLGLAREQGKLTEKTTLADIFPDLLVKVSPEWKSVTVEALLAHQAGLTQLEPMGKDLGYLHRFTGPLPQQRERWLMERLVAPPDKTQGAYSYSNAGYIVLGMVLERAFGQAWEALVRERLWQPLGIVGGGFGAPPQLWQHHVVEKKLVPVPFESKIDNPPLLGPAGKAYLPLEGWARFVTIFTSEGAGLLRPETVQWLTTPTLNGSYAGGWIVLKRVWGGGEVLTHAGSNTMNYCVAWVAPKKQFAALVATNAYGPDTPKACDGAVGLLLRHYLN